MGRTRTRVGVIGYGYWGSKHVRVMNSLPDVEVTVIDSDEQRLREAMGSFPSVRIATDLTSELDNLDAVVVSTPPAAHASVALEAINAGLHALVEKPLANSVAEAEDLVAAARAKDVRLMVGHTFEYNAAVWKLKEIISSGELGRVLYIDAARLSLGRYQNDCNVIWDLAPHDISIVSYLLDEVPSSVSVWAQRNIGSEHADMAYVKLDFDKAGAPAFVQLSWLHPEKIRRVTVVGERKMAVYNDMSDTDRIRVYDQGVDPKQVDEAAEHGFPVSYRTGDIVAPYVHFHEPLLEQDRHFIECVRTGREPRTPGGRGLDIVRVLAATDVASANGGSAPVDPARDLTSSAKRAGGHVNQPVPFLDLAGVNGALRAEFEQAFAGVLAHGRFINGPEVAAFEAQFADYCSARACVGVANGTDALELILAGLGIGPGDEVIVPANTFIATVEAICYVGARPRFVDVRPDTLLIDPDAADAAVNPRTAAVIGVHLYGQMIDTDRVLELTRKHGLAFIEDAAQAHGARFSGQRAGSVGVAAGFSFYPGKNLGALGDGGAVVTQDVALADKIRRLADHGRSTGSRFHHDLRGRNSRLDTVQAAALSLKLRGLDQANAGRVRAWEQYVAELPTTVRPVSRHPKAEAVYHLAIVEVDDREAVCAALDAAGVGWGLHYKVPCHLDSAYTQFAESSLPVVEAAAERILSLPMSPTLTEQQVSRVCDVLREATGGSPA